MDSSEHVPRAPWPPQEDNERQSDPENNLEQPMLYCPVCNHRLVSHRCKLICEQCGYFMSCADYY